MDRGALAVWGADEEVEHRNHGRSVSTRQARREERDRVTNLTTPDRRIGEDDGA